MALSPRTQPAPLSPRKAVAASGADVTDENSPSPTLASSRRAGGGSPISSQRRDTRRDEILTDFLDTSLAETACKLLVLEIVGKAADTIADNHFNRLLVPYTVQGMTQQLLTMVRAAFVQIDHGREMPREAWAVDSKPTGTAIDPFARGAVLLVPPSRVPTEDPNLEGSGQLEASTGPRGSLSSRDRSRASSRSGLSMSEGEILSGRKPAGRGGRRLDHPGTPSPTAVGHHKSTLSASTSSKGLGASLVNNSFGRQQSASLGHSTSGLVGHGGQQLPLSVAHLSNSSLVKGARSMTPRLAAGESDSDRSHTNRAAGGGSLTPKRSHATGNRSMFAAVSGGGGPAKSSKNIKSEQQLNQVLLEEQKQQQLDKRLEGEDAEFRLFLEAKKVAEAERRAKVDLFEAKLHDVIALQEQQQLHGTAGLLATRAPLTASVSPAPTNPARKGKDPAPLSPSPSLQSGSNARRASSSFASGALDASPAPPPVELTNMVLDFLSGEVHLVEAVPENAVVGPSSMASIPKYTVKKEVVDITAAAGAAASGGSMTVGRGSKLQMVDPSTGGKKGGKGPAALSPSPIPFGSPASSSGGGSKSRGHEKPMSSKDPRNFVVETEAQALAPVIYFPAQGVSLQEGDTGKRQAEFLVPKAKMTKRDFLRSLTPYFQALDDELADPDENGQQQKKSGAGTPTSGSAAPLVALAPGAFHLPSVAHGNGGPKSHSRSSSGSKAFAVSDTRRSSIVPYNVNCVMAFQEETKVQQQAGDDAAEGQKLVPQPVSSLPQLRQVSKGMKGATALGDGEVLPAGRSSSQPHPTVLLLRSTLPKTPEPKSAAKGNATSGSFSNSKPKDTTTAPKMTTEQLLQLAREDALSVGRAHTTSPTRGVAGAYSGRSDRQPSPTSSSAFLGLAMVDYGSAADGPQMHHDAPHFGAVHGIAFPGRPYHGPTPVPCKASILQEVNEHRKLVDMQRQRLATKVQVDLHAMPAHSSQNLVMHPE